MSKSTIRRLAHQMPEDEQARFLAATFSRQVLAMALEIKELELAEGMMKERNKAKEAQCNNTK